MRIVTSAAAMQRLALRWRRTGARIGFVPTMGYLHDGHLSLVHQARRRVGQAGIVVASIYVNPTQFAPTEDLSAYPRDLDRDKALCRKAGVDVLFLPLDTEMYPGRDAGGYSTYVVEEQLSQGMEGGARPTHFRGVTTIVTKLFNLVLPEVAVFGAKDWQQAAVLRRMTRDLNFPVKFVVAPTLREKDGLAMSSRNRYLSKTERAQATAIHKNLQQAAEKIRSGINQQTATRAASRSLTTLGFKVDYVTARNAETLAVPRSADEPLRLIAAAWLGKTRLIDNIAV